MKNFQYIFLAIITLGLISCEKEIEFKGEITDQLLVVNSIIEADSIVMVDISLSNFFLDNKNHFDTVKNADVKLYVNNQLKEKLIYVNGFYDTEVGNTIVRRYKNGYFSKFRPTTGDSIKITVNVPGYDEVTAFTQVVPNAKVLGIETSMDITQGGSYDLESTDSIGRYIVIGKVKYGYMHVKLKIDDPAEVENFYRLVVHTSYGPTFFEHDDPVFGEGSEQSIFEIGGYNEYGIFNDALFNGHVKELNFSIWKNTYEIYDEFKDKYKNSYFYESNENLVDLQQISKEAYLYLKTSSEAGNSTGNPFAEPVQIYTNIRGGLGVLGTYNKLDSLIRIPN